MERLKDFDRIRPGVFVIMTLNKMGDFRRQIKKWLKLHGKKIQFVFDESDEIPIRLPFGTKAALDCFRRCYCKLLTTGTSTRNNISEFAPQLELLYNNSVNMLCWCDTTYSYDREDGRIVAHHKNPLYGNPFPPINAAIPCSPPAIYRRNPLCSVLESGLRTSTTRIYWMTFWPRLSLPAPLRRSPGRRSAASIRLRCFAAPEREVYNKVMKEFEPIWRNYYTSTGNHRKDAMLKLMQQITLMLRVSAAPNTLAEYESGTIPVKIRKAVDLTAQWENEIVAIGVRHKVVLDAYAEAIQQLLPNRPLIKVTGSTTSFAKRRALRKSLKETGNGILLCTQQSLPSSVNFEYVNKIILPELHYNNSGMSQFYMRFIRYTSTEFKDIYFLTYAGSLESNLMQMVVAKEKINLFMKGKDADLDEIYEKFGIDYNLMALLMRRELDEKGHFQIRWGKQLIA